MKQDIPRELLERINEFTSGGFILFYVGADGNTEFIPFVDNATVGRGIISFIEDIAAGIRSAEKGEIIRLFSNTDGEED